MEASAAMALAGGVSNSVPFMVMFIALFACVVVAWFWRSRDITFVPESGVFIAVGVLIGGINYGIQPGVPLTIFDPALFLYGFLPVIIFEAGYSMNKREFFNNIGVINNLAIAGTVISTLIVGYGLYWFERLGIFTMDGTPLVPLLFGSIISAIDPVATLVVFSSLNVDRTLYSIVFGESVMNDAVAVALYQTFASFLGLDGFGASELFEALGLFIAKFLGSFCVGLLISFMVSKFLKHCYVEYNYMVLAMFSCTAYIVYNLCESIMLSGILGVFFCGMGLKHYAFYNVSHSSQHASEDFLKTLAFLAESVIYVYLGMSFFDVALQWNASFIAWSVALCLIGRALNVFPLVFITNFFRVKKISFKFQFLAWFSGLRGAIAFALSLLIPVGVDGVQQGSKDMIVAATLFIVVSTTLFIGGSTPSMLRLLNIKMGDVVTEQEIRAFVDEDRAVVMHKSLHGRWHNLDRNFLMPFLSNRDVGLMHQDSGYLPRPRQSDAEEDTPIEKARLMDNSVNYGAVAGSNGSTSTNISL